ncbi:hypothetical protein [Synechococcus sp. RedBA-s]|uniref:hypothetical protein n=1 Tax=Synechococcus sp. RedBA-s TaxID=2823741 RepID=UPI0020CC07BB|nr:hypothetical protein [Synechococcus sp. RedBA-s]MCP9799915.1 hypothetical protein [Synechococcus sp. RedBA-s]
MSIEPGSPWVPIAELSAAVGPSERQIHKLKTQGVLRPGHHFYAVGSDGGQQFYSVPRVREALLELAAKKTRRRKPAEVYDQQHTAALVEAVK